ncbi:MAG: patatin-like phospholipase family protein [bacterium]
MPDSPLGAISSDQQRPIDLVLEGGGVKGIGLVGALDVLVRHNFVPQRIAGTSAGAITAALLAAGYKPEEMKRVLDDLDFTRFMDEGPGDSLPLIGHPLSVLRHQGVFQGDEFLRWMEEMLGNRGVEFFGDLIYEDSGDEEFRHGLQVIASDITGGRMLILPRDSPAFGVEPDRLSVARAVRMSMGIPIFFEPWKWGQNLIVDGGLLSNFPVFLFDAPPEKRRWHTFGLLLAEEMTNRPVDDGLPPQAKPSRPAIVEFGKRLLQTMLEAHDRIHVDNDTFLRTIMIDTLGVRTTDFELDPDVREALYESGQAAATKFLSGWEPDSFEALHDAGARVPGRRELLGRALDQQD